MHHQNDNDVEGSERHTLDHSLLPLPDKSVNYNDENKSSIFSKLSLKRILLGCFLLTLCALISIVLFLYSQGAFDKIDEELPLIEGDHVIERNSKHSYPIEVESIKYPKFKYRLIGCRMKTHELDGVNIHVLSSAIYVERELGRKLLKRFYHRFSKSYDTIKLLNANDYKSFLSILLNENVENVQTNGLFSSALHQRMMMSDIGREFYKGMHSRTKKEWIRENVTQERINNIDVYFKRYFDRDYKAKEFFIMENYKGNSLVQFESVSFTNDVCSDEALMHGINKLSYDYECDKDCFNLFGLLFDTKYDK